MRSDVARDLSRSAKAFQDVVWPAIADYTGGGELVSVEGVSATEFAKALDVLAGIDAWHLLSNDGRMRGIASRVQWMAPGKSPWNSFTIRKSRTSGASTEYVKRMHALRNWRDGWLFPGLTVQAYLEQGTDKLLSVGVVRTLDLFKHVETGRQGMDWLERSNSVDDNVFIVVYWNTLQRNGTEGFFYSQRAGSRAA